ncbi:chromosome partitioning protein ParB [Thermodesulfobacterium sp. TA1]|uniref:ParB/RepB/Spo0J family partition protein n=1 Tax=Thermodesulfobacterium sp. TA1 TaxID=2234087 RepID=UPI0012318E47|nr:ParB N-terminal domain-containing protein [Thermodesulfobacterium sp. TA1]QER41671.1 chromosome partitioning protein ParB [Thermodesulfobacterium sp. TA1]
MKEIATFDDPVRKQPLTLAIFDLEEIHRPPFQRDISESLKKHLEMAIEKLGFLTPIVVVNKNGKYYVVDGQHRLEAMKDIGAREIVGIIVDESLYHHILEFNTEKPPNVKEKSKQAYRLYQDLLKEDENLIEEELFTYFKDPMFITFGFAIEEFDPKFPASFYESFVSKIDEFLRKPLKESAEERRKRAKALIELNQVVNQKYAEFGWDNALLKGEIVRKAVQKAFGVRVRTIEEEFYSAIKLVKQACESLTPQDFGEEE